MTNHDMSIVLSAMEDPDVVNSGTFAAPATVGPAIADDMVRYIYKIRGDNATGGLIELRVFAGDALNAARRQIASIMVPVGGNAGSNVNYPPNGDSTEYILKVKPNTNAALLGVTQENLITFGTAGAGNISDVAYEYVDKRA